jgi:hypothetical protein
VWHETPDGTFKQRPVVAEYRFTVLSDETERTADRMEAAKVVG